MKSKIQIICLLFSLIITNAQKIDVKHIKLNLTFNWQKKQAKGLAEISFFLLEENDKVTLDAAFLSINSILKNNQVLSYQYAYNDQPKNLEINLGKIYKTNEIVTLLIDYQTNYENKSDPNNIGGSFGKGLRFFQPTSTSPLKRKQIWSNGEPESNKYWFPCNEDISDIHTTEIIASVEKPLIVVSNGNLVKTFENQDGSRTFHYKSDLPFPNYLVSIAIGEYVNVKQKSGLTVINNYGYPDEKEAVKATTELLPDMMKFIEAKLDYKFPYKNYSQIVVQDYPFPGLVGQNSCSIISDNYIDDYGVHKDFKYLWDGVAVKALTNQWFGNLIMPKTWKDIWLNNSFAEYFAGLYTEKDNGTEEYLLWYYAPYEKAGVIGDWYAGNRHPIVPITIKDFSTFTTDNYSKLKGALVLRMLQNEMGEQNWWKSIQYFIKTYANQQVSTKDFQNCIEKISGKSYQWFFDQWIYKIGLPKLNITKSYDTIKKSLTVNVKQIQIKEENSEYEQVSFFEGKINIEIDQSVKTIYLKPQQENIFTFNIEEPSFVNFNVEETFLCETEFNVSNEEYLIQLQKSKDIIAKQNAIFQLIEIANNSNTSIDFKQKIINAFISEIKSKKYWRYRSIVLNSLSSIIKYPLDEKIISLLIELIKNEKSWLKSYAINILGKTQNPKYLEIYEKTLNDESDRVINVGAIAIGRTKSEKSFDLLMNLENQKSWKNQNRISALNGLQQLGNQKAVEYVLNCIKDIQSPRWYLATPVWDYPFAAINTIVALNKASLAYPILFERFKKSLLENDVNDIFQNVQLINLLKVEVAKEIYPLLREKFKDDNIILESIKNYENQFLENLK